MNENPYHQGKRLGYQPQAQPHPHETEHNMDIL